MLRASRVTRSGALPSLGDAVIWSAGGTISRSTGRGGACHRKESDGPGDNLVGIVVEGELRAIAALDILGELEGGKALAACIHIPIPVPIQLPEPVGNLHAHHL